MAAGERQYIKLSPNFSLSVNTQKDTNITQFGIDKLQIS